MKNYSSNTSVSAAIVLPYPRHKGHLMAMRDDVMAAVKAMCDEPYPECSEAIQNRLISQGYTPLRAALLEMFTSIAFGRAWIRKLPGPPAKLANTAQIHCKGNRWREIRLADVPEFTEALAIAEEALDTGSIPWEQFSRCCGSAEVDCINQTINAGRFAGGGIMTPPLLMGLSEVPGFEDWYQALPWKRGDRRWWRFWA